jgi:hypothetical protein
MRRRAREKGGDDEMRTEAEIKTAISEVTNAANYDASVGPTPLLPMLLMCLDVLQWANGDNNTNFERDVMENWRAVDRAARQ